MKKANLKSMNKQTKSMLITYAMVIAVFIIVEVMVYTGMMSSLMLSLIHIYKKGAAIFLHCTESNPYTGGCVAVKEKYMKKIMKTVDKNAKICIYPK